MSQASRSLSASPQPVPVAHQPQEAGDEYAGEFQARFLLFNAMPSWVVSGIVHFLGMIILALITIVPPPISEQIQAIAPPDERMEEVRDLAIEKPINLEQTLVANTASETVAEMISESAEATETTTVIEDVDQAQTHVELSEFGAETAPKTDLVKRFGSLSGNGLEGRGDKMRAQIGAIRGSNAESEAAVANALRWLAAHQNADGSWNFDHRLGQCNGRCANPGNLTDCRTGA